jgi:hypothetical protein
MGRRLIMLMVLSTAAAGLAGLGDDIEDAGTIDGAGVTMGVTEGVLVGPCRDRACEDFVESVWGIGMEGDMNSNVLCSMIWR